MSIFNPSFLQTLRSNRLPFGQPTRALGAFVLITAFVGAWAPGTALAYDEVSLQNGGIVKGEILVLQPGEKVVIKVPGEDNPRTIPWSQINDVVPEGEAEASRQPSTGNADGGVATAALPDPNQPGVVRVHIDAKGEDASLIEHVSASVGMVGDAFAWASHIRVVCKAPCDTTVDGSRGQTFVIVGEDMPVSPAFTLNEHRGEVTADVDPGSDAGMTWGATMGTFGVLGLIGGGSTLLVGALVDEEESGDIVTAGAVTTALGAGLLLGGIFMIAGSTTDVTVTPRRAYSGGYQARAPRYWLGEF